RARGYRPEKRNVRHREPSAERAAAASAKPVARHRHIRTGGKPMNRDLGVWTNEDTALVLIDYQKEQLESIRSETNADLIELHARWLVRTARAFGVPIVLSTVGVGYGFHSPTQPPIPAQLTRLEPI